MHLIYINNSPLYLTQKGITPNEILEHPVILFAQYTGKPKSIFNYIDKLEKGEPGRVIVLVGEDLPQLWADFQQLYHIIEAAGGVVQNPKGEVLLIHRLGSWDLPKGKIDPGETPQQAAIREVQEETGLQEITLGAQLPDTYHTYTQKGTRILKRTYWFRMTTLESKLTPQTSENIEQAVWENLPHFLSTNPTIYPSILDILHAYQGASSN